jgi:hypothetical protein
LSAVAVVVERGPLLLLRRLFLVAAAVAVQDARKLSLTPTTLLRLKAIRSAHLALAASSAALLQAVAVTARSRQAANSSSLMAAGRGRLVLLALMLPAAAVQD